MGTIASACCDETSSKEPDKRPLPANPNKANKKKELPLGTSANDTNHDIKSTTSTEPLKKPDSPKHVVTVADKNEDVSELIERMYPPPKVLRWDSF